jgi:YVTN family beta-propeller protein
MLLLFAAAGLASAQTLLVLNKEDATLAFLDPASGKVTARVPVGEGPHELALSSDRKLAFVSNYGTGQKPGNSISIVDTRTKQELRRLDLGILRRPHGLWFAAGKLFFTAEANKVIGTYDPSTGKVDSVLGTGQVGTHMVLATPDAARIFTANIGGDSICLIEGMNQTVIPVGKGPEGLDLTADGRQLWTAHSRDGGVSIIDVATRKVVETFNAGTKRSNRIKLTPDGKLALISDLEGGELVVVDAPARRVTRRIPLGKAPEGILIAPGGDRAYIAVAGDNQVVTLDLKTFAVTARFEPGKGPDGLAWLD